MNQDSKRILTGLHQNQEENEIQPDRRKESEGGMKTISPLY